MTCPKCKTAAIPVWFIQSSHSPSMCLPCYQRGAEVCLTIEWLFRIAMGELRGRSSRRKVAP